MKKTAFSSPEAMFSTILSGQDLYSESMNLYVFVYNESGSICVYGIDKDKALELEKKSNENHEYWTAYLGSACDIYDSESYYKECEGRVPADAIFPIDLCRKWWQDEWYTCGPFLRETGKETA